ncbi:immune-induced peptide 1-like [Drosophila miranda]|uniref:immune-induced peptide 1-like n=1 Tax=Drosophila miranda TaxID=7229 RepID=UPI00143F3B8B|nr:immune-induced peptide 1-like [Drosophila miranda]
MKFFSVVTVFVLGLLALANAVPLSPDPGNVVINGACRPCPNIDRRPYIDKNEGERCELLRTPQLYSYTRY